MILLLVSSRNLFVPFACFFNFNFLEQDFANFTSGIIIDPETGREFESVHGGLTPEDCQNVGRVAAEVWRLDKMVDWFEAAVARYSFVPICEGYCVNSASTICKQFRQTFGLLSISKHVFL